MEALNTVDYSMYMPSTTSLVFSIAMLVLAAVVLYKLFEKAGVPSWKALSIIFLHCMRSHGATASTACFFSSRS